MKKILVRVDEQLALGMVCYFINLNGRTIKSRKEFYSELRSYIESFGESCVDDHETEVSEENHEIADETVQKYFS